MLKTKEIQKELDYFKNHHEKDIAKEFFKDFTTGSEVSRKLYPDAKRKKNVGIVSNWLMSWRKLGYIEVNSNLKVIKDNKNGTKYSQKIPHYRLNLNFFFDYASKVNFNKTEKEIIKSVFNIKEIRERACLSNSLIEGIENILSEIFLVSPMFNGEYISKYFMAKYYATNLKKLTKRTGRLYIKDNFGSIKNFKALPKKEKEEFMKMMLDFIKEDVKMIPNSWNEETLEISYKILSLRGLDNIDSDFYSEIVKNDPIMKDKTNASTS